MNMNHPQRMANRRGVSVMEVLMSIGIVSVGLLGVVALVPVGGHQANRGFLEDYKALYGKSAYRQFELRGMGDTDNWRLYGISSAGTFYFRDIPNLPVPAQPQGFCLDPRFLARENPASNTSVARFPYRRPSGTDYFQSANDPSPLHRITLNAQGNAMPQALADLIFQSSDDLTLDKPKDRSLPPVQWDAVGNGNGPMPWQTVDDTTGLDNPNDIVKRQAEGNLSWLATIVPKVTNAAGSDDLYILSLVVLEKRLVIPLAEINTTDTAALNPTKQGLTERVVEVAAFPGGGFGGGEVKLATGNTPLDLQNEEQDFGTGNWIMLMRGSPWGSIYRWYKVIAAEDELGDSDTSRIVTLDGPDWAADPNFQTYAVIMPGVVTVYEKTVRLEGSSLFQF